MVLAEPLGEIALESIAWMKSDGLTVIMAILSSASDIHPG